MMLATSAELETTNRKLRLLVERLSNTTGPQNSKAADLVAVLAELSRSNGLFQKLSADQDAQSQKDIVEYRNLLTCLRDLLPDVHTRLLTERARLEAERAHLQAASDWARAMHHH